MILTPEEQTEAREEIDYAIETHGYEYVWGKETAMDKTKGLLRDAPGKIMDGINKIVTNPTVIQINDKLAAHNAKLNAEDSQKRNGPRQHNPVYNEQHYHSLKKKKKRPPEPEYYEPEPSPFSGSHPFGEHPLGKHPLGENPMQKRGNKMKFGGDHL